MGLGLLDDIFAGSGGVSKVLHGLLGGTGVITTPGAETYDPLSGTSGAGTATQFPVDVSPPSRYSLSEINGTNILAGDMKTSIPASDVIGTIIPSKSQLTLGVSTFLIVNVDPVMSGDEVASYDLQLRK